MTYDPSKNPDFSWVRDVLDTVYIGSIQAAKDIKTFI